MIYYLFISFLFLNMFIFENWANYNNAIMYNCSLLTALFHDPFQVVIGTGDIENGNSQQPVDVKQPPTMQLNAQQLVSTLQLPWYPSHSWFRVDRQHNRFQQRVPQLYRKCNSTY
jgi:hypothetical protein